MTTKNDARRKTVLAYWKTRYATLPKVKNAGKDERVLAGDELETYRKFVQSQIDALAAKGA